VATNYGIIMVVVVVVVVVILIVTLVITFMQHIYNYIPASNHVSGVYTVAAVMY
jgi:hypothetical protein